MFYHFFQKPARYFDSSTQDEQKDETSMSNVSKQKEDETASSISKKNKWKEKQKGLRREADPFPGPAPISDETIQKYKRGKSNKIVSICSRVNILHNVDRVVDFHPSARKQFSLHGPWLLVYHCIKRNLAEEERLMFLVIIYCTVYTPTSLQHLQ